MRGRICACTRLIRIWCTPRYEENRAFETLAAQEAYLRFDCWQDGQCDVRICTDEGIKERAMAEIRTMLPSGKEEL